MAQGLLGTGLATAGGGAVTVYTVPAGISHAVVHITLAPQGSYFWASTGGAVRVNFTTVLTPQAIAIGTAGSSLLGGSVSMMLSPGDVVDVTAYGAGSTAQCTVSGYEVP